MNSYGDEEILFTGFALKMLDTNSLKEYFLNYIDRSKYYYDHTRFLKSLQKQIESRGIKVSVVFGKSEEEWNLGEEVIKEINYTN